MPYGNIDLTQIGLGNGVLPNSTKQSPKPIDFSLLQSCAFNLRAISQWLPKLQFYRMNLGIIPVRLLPHLPVVHEIKTDSEHIDHKEPNNHIITNSFDKFISNSNSFTDW